MNKSRASRQVYADLLERYGRLVADAFFRALDDLRSQAEIQRVMAAIESRNLDEALDALHIDPEAFSELAERIRQSYAESGKATSDLMPKRRPDGVAMVVRFDGRNPEAEAWLSRHSSDLITRLTQEQRQLVRATLSVSMEQGRNPRQAALDIVGRVNRVTGKREGGILGLTTAQARFVDNPNWLTDPKNNPPGARQQLNSTDPALLKGYLTRKRRDKRFDRSVTKAIREGRPVDPDIAAKAMIAYERRLLKLRGETIGRVETMTSLQSAKHEAYRQAIAAGKVAASAITKVWRSAGDLRVRHTHQGLNRDKAKFHEPFVSPSGARLLYPMDRSLGAGANEVVGCRCDCEYQIDFYADLE